MSTITLNLKKKLELIPESFTKDKQISINIWKISLDGIVDNKLIKHQISQYRNEFPASATSSVKSWHSSLILHHITDVFNPCIEVFERKVNELLSDKYYRYSVDNFWAAVYEKNSHTIRHNHAHFPYVFVYFVDADDNSSPLIIEDIEIKPKPSMMVIFSGAANHYVPKCDSDSSRIILAGNLLMVSKGFAKVEISKKEVYDLEKDYMLKNNKLS